MLGFRVQGFGTIGSRNCCLGFESRLGYDFPNQPGTVEKREKTLNLEMKDPQR